MREIEYQPRNLRESLVDLKDSSELAVDLAYSALLFNNEDVAREVFELQERVHFLRYHARIALMLAAKQADDAERLVGIFQVVESAVDVTDAAADIAGILLDDVGLPEEFKSGFPEAHEDLVQVEVADGSAFAGRSLADLRVDVESGVRVIGIRRGENWNFDPEGEDELRAGDVLIARGPQEGVETVYERAAGEAMPETAAPTSEFPDLDRAVETVFEMKNLSELTVGLSYSAALFDSDALAEQVQSLESESDDLKESLELWILEAATGVDDVRRLRGLFHLAVASEVICDAALDIAEVVLRDVELHPVFGQAVMESREVVTGITILDDDEIESVADVEFEEETGMVVMARRRGDEWRFDPGPELDLRPDDVVLVRGPREGAQRLRELVR